MKMKNAGKIQTVWLLVFSMAVLTGCANKNNLFEGKRFLYQNQIPAIGIEESKSVGLYLDFKDSKQVNAYNFILSETVAPAPVTADDVVNKSYSWSVSNYSATNDTLYYEGGYGDDGFYWPTFKYQFEDNGDLTLTWIKKTHWQTKETIDVTNATPFTMTLIK